MAASFSLLGGSFFQLDFSVRLLSMTLKSCGTSPLTSVFRSNLSGFALNFDRSPLNKLFPPTINGISPLTGCISPINIEIRLHSFKKKARASRKKQNRQIDDFLK